MLTSYILVASIAFAIIAAAILLLVKRKNREIDTLNNDLLDTKKRLGEQVDILSEDKKLIISKAKTILEKKESKINAAKSQINILNERINALSKYEGVVNTDELITEKKKQFIAQRDQAIAKLKQEVKQTKEKIKTVTYDLQARQNIVDRSIEAKEKRIKVNIEKAEEKILQEQKEVRKAIREQYKEAKQKHEEIFMASSEEAADIIARAEKQAEKTAGNALKALNNEMQLEKAIKAMKNTIKGYGEEYLIPGYGLLDELADEYDFRKAGQELKMARENVRLMIKNETAATCDYVEANRRHYAIHFVLDAFNGKIATALSKVRHDNYGKLHQQIIDAFNLVNHNGSAFRSARINQQYLDLRLDELKWAVAAHELRLQDREEQKRIKQEIREEAKAKKEYEKAIREAEKEEKMLQKAIEKAKRELSSASEAQKAQYEAQLKELEGKLSEAEKKNQRAISMAQQTRRGHVYVISNEGSFGEDVLKIGLTRRLEPMDRVKELGDASVPFPFDVHAMMYSEDAPTLERDLHKKFSLQQMNKVNPRKEFFRVNVATVKDMTKELGIEAHWTLAAEARQYRESLAMHHHEDNQYT